MGNKVKKFLCLFCIFFTFSITPIVYGEDISLNVDKNEVTTQVSVSSDEYQNGDATPQNQYDVTKSSNSYDNQVSSDSHIHPGQEMSERSSSLADSFLLYGYPYRKYLYHKEAVEESPDMLRRAPV